jgi:hypothetical protein
MMTWLLPGLLLQAAIHVAAPGHTLFSVVALCIVGGYVLTEAFPNAGSREIALAGGVLLNAMFFLNYFPLPTPAQPGAPRSVWASARDASAFGVFETSINSIRYVDDVARITLTEIRDLTPENRPVVIITTDIHRVDWFLNWRIVRYYLPSCEIWAVDDQQAPGRAQHIIRDHVLESMSGDTVRVPVPRSGRILWLLETGAPFHRALAATQPIASGQRVAYMDVAADATPFRVLDYEFVPMDISSRGLP